MKASITIFGLLGIIVIGGAVSICCAKNRSAVATVEQTKRVKEVTFPVEGMTCAMCHLTVKAALKKVDGVIEAVPSHEKRNCYVKYDASKVTPKELVNTINKNTPYRASLKDNSDHEVKNNEP